MKNIIPIIISILAWATIDAQCPNVARKGYHVIQPKENLYRISQKYGVSIAQLCEWNNISVQDKLVMCQELQVAAITTAKKPDATSSSKQPQVRFYGQNSTQPQTPQDPLPQVDARLATPAPNMNTSPKPKYETPAASSPQPNNSRFRQVVPNDAPVAATPAELPKYPKQGRRHIVREGETVAGLAHTYGYTEERFREFNALSQIEELPVGSVVITTECSCPIINEPYHDVSVLPEKPAGDKPWPTPEMDKLKNRIQGTTTPSSTPKINQGTSTPPVVTTPSSQNPDTAGAADYLTAEEREMVAEINLLRGNPSGYVKYVEEYRRKQQAKGYPTNDPLYQELITELKNTAPLSILQPSKCIHQAAKAHGLDLQIQGKNSHKGSDGKWPWERIKDTCPKFSEGNENLVAGLSTVRGAVITLLLDDGIPSRGHRKTLLNPIWTHTGSYKVGRVGDIDHSWVQKFGKINTDNTGY